MQDERREHSRIRAYLPVRLHSAVSPHTIETLTKDLGAGGIRFVSPVLCPVSTDVTVELLLSSQGQFTARGKLSWFHTIPESEQFECGVIFTELSDENKRRLSAFFDHLPQKSILYHS